MKQIQKTSLLKAILGFRCPACRKGHIFKDQKKYAPFSLTGMQHKECPHCKQDLIIEPGFDFGAYYISYALNVIYFGLATIIGFFILDSRDIKDFVAFDVSIVIVALPYTLRISRVLNFYLLSGIKFKDSRFNGTN